MEYLNSVRKILAKFKIPVVNVIPSEDYKAIKIISSTKNYKYSTKLLQQLIKTSENNFLFSLGVSSVGYIDLIIHSEDAMLELSMLGTVDISNVSKILKKENSFHYENTENSDLFHIFYSDTKPLYSDTIKSLLKLYLKNKIDFYISADTTLRHLILSYPKKIKEESAMKYDRIISKAKSSIEKASFGKNDTVLCISYQEIIDTVVSNLGTEDISASQVDREFKEILKLKLETAHHELRNNMNTILQEIKK